MVRVVATGHPVSACVLLEAVRSLCCRLQDAGIESKAPAGSSFLRLGEDAEHPEEDEVCVNSQSEAANQ